MNIYLKTISPQDGNPFHKYPELKSIWEPELSRIAIEAIDENFQLANDHPDADLGHIFLICIRDNNKEKPIGISGYFPSKEDFSEFTLRWHGLLEDYRGMGYSKKVIESISSYILKKYPNAKEIIEFMPIKESYKEVEQYFNNMGFQKVGSPETVEWSNHQWQSYAYNLKSKRI